MKCVGVLSKCRSKRWWNVSSYNGSERRPAPQAVHLTCSGCSGVKLLPTGLAVALIRVPADPALDLKYRTMRCLWLWPGDCQWHRPLPASYESWQPTGTASDCRFTHKGKMPVLRTPLDV